MPLWLSKIHRGAVFARKPLTQDKRQRQHQTRQQARHQALGRGIAEAHLTADRIFALPLLLADILTEVGHRHEGYLADMYAPNTDHLWYLDTEFPRLPIEDYL